ncbi:MAG TPA: hypothetical protein VGF34_12245 [Stellaceae bacterium]
MNLRALAFCAGILALLCSACVPPPPPPGPPPIPGPMSITCPGLDAFKAKVSVLSLPFDLYGPNHAPPAPAGPVDPNSLVAGDLWSAFCAAPPALQRDLVSLDNVFVNPCADVNSCGFQSPPVCDLKHCHIPAPQVAANSWGFREWRNIPTKGRRYIAISAGLWPNGGHAPDLDAFETNLISQLLFWPSGAGVPQPTYLSNPSIANHPELTVMAALAHELGHVRWYDAFVQVPGGSQNLRRLCNGAFFSSWQGNVPAPPHWSDFGLRAHRHKRGLVQIQEIDQAIVSNNLPTAGVLLDRGANGELGIFAPSAPWASFFASVSPQEDFVESYKLHMLTQAQPNLSLPIQIPYASTEDVPTALHNGLKPELKDKIACVAGLPAFAGRAPASDGTINPPR